jgi:hypothetical protein
VTDRAGAAGDRRSLINDLAMATRLDEGSNPAPDARRRDRSKAEPAEALSEAKPAQAE